MKASRLHATLIKIRPGHLHTIVICEHYFCHTADLLVFLLGVYVPQVIGGVCSIFCIEFIELLTRMRTYI